MKRDDQQALLLLESASQSDPTNSAPLLFAAIVETRRQNETAVKELLSKILKTNHFNSYLKDFTFTLFDGVRYPSDLLAAQEIWSMTPVPDYYALSVFIKERKLSKVAYQLTQDGLRRDRSALADLSWIAIEYASGNSVLTKLGLGADIPGYREILKLRPSHIMASTERTLEELEKTCSLSAIQDEVQQVRNYLDEAKENGL